MRSFRCCFLLCLFSAGLLAAAEPMEQVQQALDKLKSQSNYTWTAQLQLAGGQLAPKPIQGKTEKGGYTVVTHEMNQGIAQAVFKGDKVVVKSGDVWQTPAEMRSAASGDGTAPERGAMTGRVLARTRTAADEGQDALKKTRSLKEAAPGVYVGELTTDGVKELLVPGLGRANNSNLGPTAKDAKGSVKFWIERGILGKFEVQAQGTVSFRGQDRAVNRTRTFEIQDPGTTKVEVPEGARKKLDS